MTNYDVETVDFDNFSSGVFRLPSGYPVVSINNAIIPTYKD